MHKTPSASAVCGKMQGGDAGADARQDAPDAQTGRVHVQDSSECGVWRSVTHMQANKWAGHRHTRAFYLKGESGPQPHDPAATAKTARAQHRTKCHAAPTNTCGACCQTRPTNQPLTRPAQPD
jgi:hypothetical protein